MYRETLQQLGLHKNEAKIYEALLAIGPAGISDVAKAAKVNRRNVYDSINNLITKDLLMRVGGPGEHVYKAANPKRLQQMLNEQKQDISAILPDLKALYQKHSVDEQAFISHGTEGIRNFWDYVVNQSGPSLFVGGKGAWHDPKINEERKIHFSECKKKNIAIQGIFDHEMLEHGYDIYRHYEPDNIRFFPKEFSTKASYDICGDRVVQFSMPYEKSLENILIYNIISQPLADSYRVWFKYLWQLAKPLPNKATHGPSSRQHT